MGFLWYFVGFLQGSNGILWDFMGSSGVLMGFYGIFWYFTAFG